MLLAELDTIDLHHGSYSADPPYTVLEVLGTPLTAKAKNELSAYGFNRVPLELGRIHRQATETGGLIWLFLGGSLLPIVVSRLT
jgi:hypothetical protein